MINIGIVGGTGYTGVELLRLLANHPQANVARISSRSEAGVKIEDYFPQLRGFYPHLSFSEPDPQALGECDLVFFATPHGVAAKMTDALLAANTKIIDLAADYRIQDLDVWQKWYGMEHPAPHRVPEAVYGLPEVNRAAIQNAQILANPGCYPTATQLGFYPLLQAGLVNGPFVVDAKSGVSGAGRGAKVSSLFSEVAEDFKAYGFSGHRHWPEIEQGLSRMAGTDIQITFTPHLLPMVRGIETSLYMTLNDKGLHTDIQALFEQTYANEPFVDVMPKGQVPSTASVKGSNICRIGWAQVPGRSQIVVTSVIDNLVKGASGQAIQNMNIMFGLPETLGLNLAPLQP